MQVYIRATSLVLLIQQFLDDEYHLLVGDPREAVFADILQNFSVARDLPK